MITYIRGKLTLKFPTHVIVEAAGIGYHVNVSLNTYNKLPSSGELKIYTHLSIKEDAHTLYGFADEEEREIFRYLLGISGIGAGTARVILSSLNPTEFVEAIIHGDVPLLKAIKGIGVKSAQRIIIELQDKFKKAKSEAVLSVHLEQNKVKEEALTAMVTLGFPAVAAEKAIVNILKDKGKDITLEELIRLTLKAI